MRLNLKNTLILILLSVFAIAKSQIYAPDADALYKTSYINHNSGNNDTIYIFSIENTSKSIIAYLEDSSPADFNWFYLNSKSASTNIKNDTNTTLSAVAISNSGCYKVIINNTDTFYCWVFIRNFDVDITSTRDGDTIANSDINCRTISYIKADIIDEDHNYFDPTDTSKNYVFRPYYKKVWSSDQPDASLKGIQGQLQGVIEEPYWENTGYIITVTDTAAKLSRDDTAFYKSVRPHAEFKEPYIIPLVDSFYYPDKDDWYYDAYDYGSGTPEIVSAPASVLFRNISKNANKYTWIFGDSLTMPTESLDSVIHEYKLPGTYYTYLVARKDVDFLYDPCYDTFPEMENPEDPEFNKILVSQVQDIDTGQVPNVFTSNHKNPWRFKQDVSIDHIEIVIFNRYGKRVHHYNGNIRDWPGWDGSDNGKGKVTTGVYFFVVKSIRPLPDFESGQVPEELILTKKGFIHYFNLSD